MSTKGFARRRDANEAEIVDALLGVGCSVQRLSDKGVPDLLVFSPHNGRTLLLEVKNPKSGRLTPDQSQWMVKWRGPVHIVTTIADALRIAGLHVRDTMPGFWAWCPAGCGDVDTCMHAGHHKRGTYPLPKAKEKKK